MRLFFAKILLSTIPLTGFLYPARAMPDQTGFARSLIAQVDSFVNPASQQAAQLVSMTLPGYYSHEVVFDKYLNATCNSSLCGSTAPQLGKSISLSGQRLDATQIQLNWTTSTPLNQGYFSVEQSSNPADGFETISLVNGRNNALEKERYKFTNPDTETGYTYYRLKQVHLDGSVTSSSIIAIKGFGEELGIKAFPNPGFAKEITFQVWGAHSGQSIWVCVFDARGTVLYQQENFVLTANQQIPLPPLPGIGAGIYFVRIITKQQQATTSFITH